MEQAQPPEMPKLTAQEKLDAVYEFKLRLFQGLVAFSPSLAIDPAEVTITPQGDASTLG